jgi:hypothetical protein
LTRRIHHRHQATTDEDLEYIGDKIESLYHYPVVTETQVKKLKIAGDYMLKAGLLGSNEAGLFKPT